jgi:hypothetical protein
MRLKRMAGLFPVGEQQGLELVTKDERIREYEAVATIW